ncbi:RluA family pseudouridine synthase [Hyphococcus luteus]|uniref:Pseudouridine synthase n=1 Tax=Hyphococcus luteus TaxID=2058213 RepID=A0A2S7JYS8_9PROT|nr:RluA family pseudouridine synthase [Marinicaulis flavus]PQA85405.1 RluA family pseudouridine synthase [Marinicaulis flavus]
MSGVQTKTVKADEEGMRLDRWFKAHFPQVRHGELEKFLRKGQVRVSGGRAKSNRRLEAGEEVRIPPLSDDAPAPRKASPADAGAVRKLIVYEDDAIIALNKPFGLAVQGGSGMKQHLDGMLAALEKDGERPRLVHRLDKDTGGLMLVAKTRQAAQRLGDAFKSHDVDKTYWALVAGLPRPKEGTIDLPIAKKMMRIGEGEEERVVPADGEDAKKAITDYQTMEEAGPVTFLAMRPVTGRTHQLRVHAAAIGCPIVGDGKYGGEKSRIEGVSPKLHLFCRSMTFPHPKTGRRMTLDAPLSGHMLETWKFFTFEKNVKVDWPEDLR